MAALIIGVIVAGLGIGALVSAFQNRGTLPELGATSAPAVTPVPQVAGPRPVVTLAPTPSPASPTPSPTRTPAASPSPARTASPSPAPTESASPAATATPSIAPATPAPSPRPTPSVKPVVLAVPTASPKPVVLSVPAVTPPPAARPAPSIPSYARPAGAAAAARPLTPPNSAEAATTLVRRYIDDLITGDEAGAYAALGGTGSDRNLSLKEEAFLDKDARITSMRVSRNDPAGATVDAEISSSRGSYVATFHVINGPNGISINQHDYIKI
jgi:hypothetical protein